MSTAGGEQKSEDASRAAYRWQAIAAIVVAAITAVGGIVVALIQIVGPPDASSTAPTWLSPTPSVSAPPPTSQSSEVRISFSVPLGDFTISGDMVWPDTDPVRSAGEFKRRGSQAALCSVLKVRFEAFDANGQLLGEPQERACETDSSMRHRYGLVEFARWADISEVHVVVMINGDEAQRIVCPRKTPNQAHLISDVQTRLRWRVQPDR